MAKNSITALMVAMIFCCSLSGCIDNSSQEFELELSDLENDGFQTVEDRWIEYTDDICFSSPNGANAK